MSIPMISGVAWYQEDQWDRLRALSADPEVLAPSFSAWLKSAQKYVDQATMRGTKVRKIIVDVDEFQQWCSERGIPMDGKARTGFVGWKTHELWKRGEIEP